MYKVVLVSEALIKKVIEPVFIPVVLRIVLSVFGYSSLCEKASLKF
jgi:hypothetical protein